MEPTKVEGNVRPLKGWRLAFLRWFKGDDAAVAAWWSDLRPVPERVYDRAASGP